MLLVGAFAPGLLATTAGATSIVTLRAKAAQLASQVDTLNTKLSILSEEYDQAQGREASLQHQISADRGALGSAESSVNADQAKLKSAAVNAYVNAGASSGLSVALSSNGDVLPLQQTYMSIASGSLSGAVATLQNSEHMLNVRTATLQKTEQAAQEAVDTLASSRASAGSLQQQLQSTLAGVNGSLAAAVAQQEAVQQQAAQAAAAPAAASAAAASPAPAVGNTGQQPQPEPAPAVGSGAGALAVKAAESQLGVPYVWAGSTPGRGFDCSGLAMWAWGQAGVNLPHSAQAQYDSIEHVPLDQLQAGDLVFYAEGGYIYHVVMYIGNGQVVQAEDTGTVISITPLWPGAYGAGRP